MLQGGVGGLLLAVGGSVAGLVTIEDLLEAIVGNIADEHDEPEADDEPIREPNGAYVVSGSFELSRLRDLFADQFEQPNRNGRPAKDFEKTVANAVAWIMIASIKLPSRRMARARSTWPILNQTLRG